MTKGTNSCPANGDIRYVHEWKWTGSVGRRLSHSASRQSVYTAIHLPGEQISSLSDRHNNMRAKLVMRADLHWDLGPRGKCPGEVSSAPARQPTDVSLEDTDGHALLTLRSP
jgi:hypothetical protein